jgi:hypothetical protein
MTKILTYSEMSQIDEYYDRLKYLMQHGSAFEETFGGLRELNQQFYKSCEWRRVRNSVIFRDGGYDLAVPGMEILGMVYVHHMNPITPPVLVHSPQMVLNPEYLITVSLRTHQMIHFGNIGFIEREIADRYPGDTNLW